MMRIIFFLWAPIRSGPPTDRFIVSKSVSFPASKYHMGSGSVLVPSKAAHFGLTTREPFVRLIKQCQAAALHVQQQTQSSQSRNCRTSPIAHER